MGVLTHYSFLINNNYELCNFYYVRMPILYVMGNGKRRFADPLFREWPTKVFIPTKSISIGNENSKRNKNEKFNKIHNITQYYKF